MTPDERRRAVEVMARAISKEVWGSSLHWGLKRDEVEAALADLLTVADVTWKENQK